MFLSIFTDELAMDVRDALPILKEWGLEYVDLRTRVLGSAIEHLTDEQLGELRGLLDGHGMKVGALQTSLAKVHLPDDDRRAAEAEKLEGIVRAADALDCPLVRAFFYWQPPAELRGELAVRPDELQKVLDAFAPLAERAAEAGLTMAFENCGVTPDEVLKVVDALDQPSWGLAWDVRNTWDCDERRRDEDAYIRRLAQRAKLLHIKARGALEGAGDDELIPYDKVLQTCHNAGVPGPAAVETHNPDRAVSDEEMSRRLVEAMQKAWPSAAPGGLFDEPAPAADVTREWQDNPVGFAVVGLGMGHNRSRQVAETPGCRLVGVSDLRQERAQRTGEEFGVPYELDFRKWLDNDDVEVVYVLTETGNHHKVALEALEAGKHVLTTKPMDASVEACDRMIRLAESKGLLLGVDFGRRYRPDLLSLRASLQSGRLGRLLSGDCSLRILRNMDYFRSNGGWRGTRELDGGGVLSNQSIHHIDELVFCLGIPARARCDLWTQTHDIEAEDLGMAAWLYDDGLALTLQATTSYPQPTWYVHLELVGETGAYFFAAGGPFDQPVSKFYLDGAWTTRPPMTAESEWLNAPDNFAAALRSGAELTCPGREGRRTQAVLDAMYRSAYDNDGDWVDVKPELED